MRLVALALVAACGAKPAPPLEAHTQTSWLASAQAAERGTGMARDYTKAAAIYASACNDGHGDLAACRRLIGAIGDARGVDRDIGRAVRIARAICERHDMWGCVIFAFASPRMPGHKDEDPIVQREIDRDRDLGAECDRGDAAACEAALVMQFPNFQGSSGVEAKQNALRAAACRAGVLDGCVALLDELHLCRYESGGTRCADKQIAEWKKYEDEDHLAALDRVRAACDRGDAEACDFLPGHEISYAERCRAHDWGICAAMACNGDKAAGEQAKLHAAEANCTKEGNLEAARHAPPPKTRAALPAEPPIKQVSAKRAPFHSLAFRRLATEPDDWKWPIFEIANVGSDEVWYFHGFSYAYDTAGHQVARTPVYFGSASIDLKPGATFKPDFFADGMAFVPDAAASFEICYDSISFASRRAETKDSTSCPEQRPRGGLAIGLDGEGALEQLRWHAAAQPASAHYAATSGTPGGASALGIAALEDGTADFVGTDRPLGKPGTIDIPVLVTGIAIAYDVKGVDDLRLSRATLAKIFQGEITQWNDPAIRRDNPRAKLPDEKIVAMHEVGSYNNDKVDFDGDAMRAVAAYLARAAHGTWKLGDDTIAWPEKQMRLMGLEILHHSEGAIVFAELSRAHETKLTRFAKIKNAAGAFVAPTPEAMRAAAAEFADAPGPIAAKAAAAYPLAYASWITVAQEQHEPAHQPALVAYLKYLLGDGQALLEPLGLVPLPEKALAKSRALVERL